MKLELMPFQETAVEELTRKVRSCQQIAGLEDPKAIVLSAPTGAGKTVIATTMIERIVAGDDTADPDQDVAFLWITDLPELNNQTYNKMINTSNILNTMNLEIIESSFNHRSLTPGKVYFLNTQKLGKDKLLTSQGDGRQYTIWQTIDNTITEQGSKLIVIIDEAHRGMKKKSEAEIEKAETIIQKFIIGNNTMRKAPLIIGITATPDRFVNLISMKRGFEPVYIDPSDVKNSGLIKDDIILHYSEDKHPKDIDITLLREATQDWQGYTKSWSEYCSSENEEPVSPIFVVQVENATKGKKGTRTNLDQVIDAINEKLPSPLPINAFAHAFDESTDYDTGSRLIRYLAPSRITDDREIQVVFFKTALSTGWDCPRAETMMSFRKAQDATYIAQLIGRMVRTPLARRIDKNERLNSVSLFLPHYNVSAVKSIVEKLRDPEHEFVPPVEVKTHLDRTELRRSKEMHVIFTELEKIPSYIFPTHSRKQKQTQRLVKLAQALVNDDINRSASKKSRTKVLELLKKKLLTQKGDTSFQEKVGNQSRVTYGTRTYNIYDDKEPKNVIITEADTAPENIDYVFGKAGRNLGGGLHKDFWELMVKDIPDHNLEEIKKTKIEITVLLSDPTILESVEKLASNIVQGWLVKYDDEINSLPENQRAKYESIKATASEPEESKIHYPDIIDWKVCNDKQKWRQHLYVDNTASFWDDFNNLEMRVLEAEITKAVGWLRNPVRKKWSLAIPYQQGGGFISKPVFPDFLFFVRENDKILIDILDPHGHHLDDAVDKAKGLAWYAHRHGHHFRRIEIITEIKKGDCRLLNLQDEQIRDTVSILTSNAQLLATYKNHGTNYPI